LIAGNPCEVGKALTGSVSANAVAVAVIGARFFRAVKSLEAPLTETNSIEATTVSAAVSWAFPDGAVLPCEAIIAFANRKILLGSQTNAII
jgi:hypothetical protein